MYSPLCAALLNCKQVASLSGISPGDQEKQNPSVLKNWQWNNSPEIIRKQRQIHKDAYNP